MWPAITKFVILVLMDPAPSAANPTSEPSVAEGKRLHLEIEKSRLELAQLIAEHKRPWIVRIVFPVLIVSLAGSFSTWIFGDSLAARTKADMRRDVLTAYFSIDNEMTGKRGQILLFVESVLSDDPELRAWALQEKKRISITEKAHMEEIADLDAQILDAQKKLATYEGSEICLPDNTISTTPSSTPDTIDPANSSSSLDQKDFASEACTDLRREKKRLEQKLKRLLERKKTKRATVNPFG